MIIFMFPGQPRGFRGARSKKPLKKSRNLSKMTKFLMFFVSSCFKTTWLTLKPINQHSVVPSGCFDTQFVPGTASIVEISLNLSVFCHFQITAPPGGFFSHLRLWANQFLDYWHTLDINLSLFMHVLKSFLKPLWIQFNITLHMQSK